MKLLNNYKFHFGPVLDEIVVQVLENSLVEDVFINSLLHFYGIEAAVVPRGKALFEIVEPGNENLISSIPSADNFKVGNSYRLEGIEGNISNIKGGTIYFSDCEGIFYLKDGVARLYPISDDGAYKINIDEKEMLVTLDLFPHFETGKKILFKEIFASLRQKKIEVEIKAKLIEEKIQVMENNRQPVFNLEVAAGKPKMDGIDGEVEYLVNTEVNFKPRVTEDGRIDFHDLNSINTVIKDQKLAIFYPPVKEIHGENVFGKKILARQAVATSFPAGQNTYADPENPNLIRAKIDGNLIKKNGQLLVSPVLNINGNVDYSTGNINNKGSVLVLGDVKSGFRIDATETIEVRGIVEDAVINAGSHVVISSGFTGSGSGLIKADGNVDVRYVRNQKIFSRKSINVTHEVMDAMLFARHRLQVAGGKHMSILGGHTIAGYTLEVNCLGNEYGIPTLVEAGFDYDINNKVKQNRYEIEQLERTLENIENGFKQNFLRMSFSPDQRKALQILIEQKILLYTSKSMEENDDTLKKVVAGIDSILNHANIDKSRAHDFKTLIDHKIAVKRTVRRKKEDIVELEKIIYTPSNAKIRVNRITFPGVTILINKRKISITQQMINKTFYLAKDGSEILIG